MQFKMRYRGSFNNQFIKQRWRRDMNDPLKRAGALVRGFAKRSLRRARNKQPSAPGTPPKHRMLGSNSGLKRILFDVNSLRTGVIIGSVYEIGKLLSPTTTPEVHEHGGPHKVKVSRRRRIGRRATPRQRAALIRRIQQGKMRRTRVARGKKTIIRTYPERPFMLPALKGVMNKFPELFRDVLRP